MTHSKISWDPPRHILMFMCIWMNVCIMYIYIYLKLLHIPTIFLPPLLPPSSFPSFSSSCAMCNKMYEEFKQQFKWKWPPILQINYEFSGSKLGKLLGARAKEKVWQKLTEAQRVTHSYRSTTLPSPFTSPHPPFYGCREGGGIISPHPRLLPFLLFIHFIDIKARSYVTWKIVVVGLFFSTFRFLSTGAAVFIFRRGHFIYLRVCFRYFMDLRVYVFSNVGRLLDFFLYCLCKLLCDWHR